MPDAQAGIARPRPGTRRPRRVRRERADRQRLDHPEEDEGAREALAEIGRGEVVAADEIKGVVKTVIIIGTATNVCCESTARSAFFRDYQVAFISDSTASFDDSMHEATLKTIDMLFGRVMSTDELLTEMGAPASVEEAAAAPA